MKAISAIIVVVLLLLISISLISVVYVWSSALTGTVTSTTEETTSELTKQLSGCLKIDAISKNQIYLRNCGKGVITNNSLSVFIDDVKVEHSVEEIGEDQTGTVNISGLWKFSMDRHNLKITNGAAFVQALIELEPNKDGLVGYWSFDEGSGNKVYDKSGNGNDGELKNGVVWTTGKFGNALSFDGVDDEVRTANTIHFDTSSNSYTFTAWVKLQPDTSNMQFIVGNFPEIGLDVTSDVTAIGAWKHGRQGTWVSVGSFANAWHHIVAVIHPGNAPPPRADIYLDGVFVGNSITDALGEYTGDTIVSIGYDSDWGAYSTASKGLIDEVHVWNKALTPDQTVVMKMV